MSQEDKIRAITRIEDARTIIEQAFDANREQYYPDEFLVLNVMLHDMQEYVIDNIRTRENADAPQEIDMLFNEIPDYYEHRSKDLAGAD